MTTTTPFRITLAAPDAIRRIEAEAAPDLREHLELIKRGLEQIPGVPGEAIYGAVTLRALALRPDIFRGWFTTEHHSAKRGEVDNATKELLATVVSRLNEEDATPTCTPYHEAAARFEGATEEQVRAALDPGTGWAELPETTRDILAFGVAAAFRPKEVTATDVERVRRHGLSDGALIEIVSTALIAYNLSALNRVFDLREGAG